MINTGTKARRHRGTKGFTLVELIVVVGLIILILTMALPAFNFITGQKSTEAAQNVISAMLSRARTMALANQRTTGVFFYFDPVIERTTLVIVEYPRYAGHVKSASFNYKKGDYVAYQASATVLPNYYICLQDHSNQFATNTAYWKRLTPGYSYYNGITPAFGTSFKGYPDFDFIDLVENAEIQTLPAGVAAQIVVNPSSSTDIFVRDGYLRNCAILFNYNGQMIETTWRIRKEGRLAKIVRLNGDADNETGDHPDPFRSGFAVVLYDRDAFRNHGFSEMDPGLDTGKSNAPWVNMPDRATYNSGTATDEQHEEMWLGGKVPTAPNATTTTAGDGGSLPLLVNRYNGTLFRSE